MKNLHLEKSKRNQQIRILLRQTKRADGSSALHKALKEILQDYPYLKDAEIVSVDTSSEVAEQPKSLDKTAKGAVNRARNAHNDCDYSFGIESGLMVVPHTKTGHMDVCVCAIFDGAEYHPGLSSAWEALKAGGSIYAPRWAGYERRCT